MKILDHRFKSAKADGADASQVQPSHWNDGHLFTGGARGDVLARDPTDAQYGAMWTGAIGTWTPSDASGAGLVFSNPLGKVCLMGHLVYIWASLVYPVTSNGATVNIGGLPYISAVGFTSGFYQTFGITHSFHLPADAANILVLHPTTFAQRTNAEMSGQTITFAGAYPTIV
jgi:hypothetical protein